jgi:hypothetical protein
VELVCCDYFSHLDPKKFVRKVSEGQLAIPMVPIEGSQACAKAIHVQDLVDYIDKRRAIAVKEYRQLHGDRS